MIQILAIPITKNNDIRTTAFTLLLVLFSAVASAQSKVKMPQGITVKKYNKTVHFKAASKRKLFVEKEVIVEWPESQKYNMTPLLQEIGKIVCGKPALSIANLEAASRKFDLEEGDGTTNGTWNVCTTPGESEFGFDIDENYPYEFPPSVYIQAEAVSHDANRGLLTWSAGRYYDYGTGVGAGIVGATEYLTLDYKNGKLVTLNDLIKPANQRAVQNLLRRSGHCDKEDVTRNYIDRLPENYRIAGNRIFFKFTKYEIASGAAGEVEVYLSLLTIKKYLTSYAVKLLKI